MDKIISELRTKHKNINIDSNNVIIDVIGITELIKRVSYIKSIGYTHLFIFDDYNRDTNMMKYVSSQFCVEIILF